MVKRLEQVNELLRKEIAMAIEQLVETPNFLITITRVNCTHDLTKAKVWLSVLPDNKAGTALEIVRRQASLIRNTVKRKITIRNTPQFSFVFDDTEKNATDIENALREINSGDI